MVRWPDLQDYREAIQHPDACFRDAELQSGSPVMDRLGLPRPISGAFASVYQMQCGERNWAVRCFLHEFADQCERYQAISDHLQSQPELAPYMVGFDFLEQGIRVAGQWFPILKMEWISGEPIDKYVEQRRFERQALLELADEWVKLLAAMRQAGIAHGDLQHGNILISDRRIRLIDYDGMFVPALQGRVSREEGHRNYQHPRRTGRYFGDYLDTFSGWVIWGSISALAHKPELWNQLRGGDECLLFRREDFDWPRNSKAFNAFADTGISELTNITDRLNSLLELDVDQLPAQLPEVEEFGFIVHSPPKSRRSSEPAASNWIEDFDTTTVWDGLPSPLVEQVLLLIACAVTVFCVPLAVLISRWWPAALVALAVDAFAFGMAWAGYRDRGILEKQRVTRKRLANERTEVEQLEIEYNSAQTQFSLLTDPLNEQRSQLAAVSQALYDEVAKIETLRTNAAATLTSQMQALQVGETEANTQREAQFLEERRRLADLLEELVHREKVELSQWFRPSRERQVEEYMRTKTVRSAQFKVIYPDVRENLIEAGILSAAEVNEGALALVPGCEKGQAVELLAWAGEVRKDADRAAGTALADDKREISNRFLALRRPIEEQLANLQAECEGRRQQMGADFRRRVDALKNAHALVEQRLLADLESARAKYEPEKKQLEVHIARFAADIDDRESALQTRLRSLTQVLETKRQQLSVTEKVHDRLAEYTLSGYLLRTLGLPPNRKRAKLTMRKSLAWIAERFVE